MTYEPESAGTSHVETVKCHPSRSISLTKRPPSRQRFRTVENTDVIESQESTLEDILSACVLAVYPPERRIYGEKAKMRMAKIERTR